MPPIVAQPDKESIADAVRRLRDGDVVAIPTETVYGLGADTFNPAALKQIYELKGRPFNNPLIAHVADVETAKHITHGWDNRCDELAKQFWPGPLTIVLRKATDVPSEAVADLDTIAVRCPDHPVAMQLLKAFGGPISAPSANKSGGVSPTTAQHVTTDFASANDLLIIDGGPCRVGIESTVLDLSHKDSLRLLRPGSITVAQLHDALGDIDTKRIESQSHSPGTSPVHYAPRTPASLLDRESLLLTLEKSDKPVAVLCFDAGRIAQPHHCTVMPNDPIQYASALYRALRDADALNVSRILIECPPQTPEWVAVNDRLRRATAI